ncbi:Asp-domain-containing protein [Thozetella sp. PMI_491]|nr:Asp-domain-containing protein [Thozetella sp. PMI_491]
MKFSSAAAVAASLLSSAGLVTALTIIEPSKFEITVLGGSTFRLQQQPNKNYNMVGRGPRALAKVYTKFGLSLPPELLLLLEEILLELGLLKSGGGSGTGSGSGIGRGNSTAPGTNATDGANQGEVSAVPQLFDSEYLASVQIGTPPQTLNLDFDTGSSDLWVFSSETPKTQVNGQKLYNIESSSTAKSLQGATWSIRYGDGSSSSGDVFLDTVSVGGVTVTSQAVESAKQVSSSFSNDTASSGLLGLAMSSINQVSPTPQKTFFENAKEQLAMPLFTANLKKAAAGNYNFGFIDNTEFTGSISFTAVNATQGFWQFETSGFSVGNGAAVSSPHQAIADTGTTLLMLPQSIVQAYYAQVKSATSSAQAGGFTFSCSEQLPDLTLDIGGYKAVVPGEVINFAPVDTNDFATAKTCFGGIQASNGLPFAIYGDIFLKAQFVVFQGTNPPQLGFASKPIQ